MHPRKCNYSSLFSTILWYLFSAGRPLPALNISKYYCKREFQILDCKTDSCVESLHMMMMMIDHSMMMMDNSELINV